MKWVLWVTSGQRPQYSITIYPLKRSGNSLYQVRMRRGLSSSSLDVSPLACSQTGRGSLLHQEQEKRDFVQLTYKLNSFSLQRTLQDIPVILVQVQISLSCILILTESDILNVHMHLYLFLYKFIQTIKLLAIRFGCRLYEVQLRAHYTADILHIQNRKESTC